MENINPIVPLSTGSSLSDTLSEAGAGPSILGINPNDNLELQKSLVAQKEAELKEMQDQIESFNQMVKQLTSQRELAIKRLADMDIKIQELTTTLEKERRQVDAKDHELQSKRTQLQTLKNEEDELKTEFGRSKKELDATNDNLTSTKLSNTHISNKISEMKQFLTNTNSVIEEIEKAIEFKDTMRLGSLCGQPIQPPIPLNVNPVLTNGQAQSGLKLNDSNEPNLSGPSASLAYDPFADQDPFEGEDPFAGHDPFKAEEAEFPLPEDDPFNPSSSSTTRLSSMDPFAPAKGSNFQGF